MAANIRSTRNSSPPTVLEGVSRDDLESGDLITLESVDPATTYQWTLMFTPDSVDNVPSSAVFLPPEGSAGPIAKFSVDNEGAYLVRLIVDQGLPTQDEQFVRLRRVTAFSGLKLVAAGERRDQFGTVPSDVDATGWADDQNRNILRMERLISRASQSGRVLTVDPNTGGAEGYADYSTIGNAISAALSDPTPPSADDPYLLTLQPGTYEEDLELQPYVFLSSANNTSRRLTGRQELDRTVYIVAENLGGNGHSIVTGTGFTGISGVTLESAGAGIAPTITVSGTGQALISNCTVLQNSTNPLAGPSLSVEAGALLEVQFSQILSDSPTETAAILVDGSNAQAEIIRSFIQGPNVIDVNPSAEASCVAHLNDCLVEGTSTDIVNGYGVRTVGSLTHLERTKVSVQSGVKAIRVNPTQLVKAGFSTLRLSYSEVPGDLEFDTTNLAASSLQLESSQHGALAVLPAPASLTIGYIEALTSGKTLEYDPTITGLTARNVQDAIDEIFFVGGGLPPFAAEQYAVLMEDPASTPIFQRVIQEMILPTLSVSISGGSIVEVGSTVTNPNMALTFTRDVDWSSEIASSDIEDTDGNPIQVLAVPPPAFYIMPFSYSETTLNASVTFTLNASDAFVSDSDTTAIQWRPRVFWFESPVDPSGGTAVLLYADLVAKSGAGTGGDALASSRSRTFTVTSGAGEYIYYAYPTDYGTATFFVGGFAGGFTLVATSSVANPFGDTRNYYIYKSNNPNLGATTVTAT